jgi:hypothetical protein
VADENEVRRPMKQREFELCDISVGARPVIGSRAAGGGGWYPTDAWMLRGEQYSKRCLSRPAGTGDNDAGGHSSE